MFDEAHLILKEYTYWKLLVRNRNTTLGNCVLVTKEHYERYSELPPEAFAEMSSIVKELEHALHAAFSYDKINYLMLMMFDKHTHFHILPRYAEPRQFAGITWTDDGWPRMSGEAKAPLSSAELQAVRSEILKFL